jgi:polar amino acid transport system substrate-binding protein
MKNIKKFAVTVVIPFLALGLLTGCGSQSSTSAANETSSSGKPLAGKHLVMAINAEYPPFESKDSSGKIVGFDLDLNDALAKKLGYTYELKDMDFTGLISSITSKRCDYAISALSANAERKKVVDFSNGYFDPVTAMIIPKNSGIASVKDLQGKKVGVTLGTNFEKFAKGATGAKVVTYPSLTAAIPMIGTNELDAAIVDSSNAFAFRKENEKLTYDIIKFSETGAYFQPYAAAFQKNSGLRDVFNKSLKELENDGTMKALKQKWFGDEYLKALAEAKK